MKYFLTSGTNLELYFSCNDNLYEKGTLHFEAYNNPKMEGFPVIKEEIQGFDLRIAHDSVYGTNKIVTGCNYSGDTWWFAWVDIIPEAESENLTLDANDQPNEPLLNKSQEQNSFAGSYGQGEFHNQRMDVAAIAYGQDHQNGINITSDESSVRRVFFQLKNNVPGFPRFGVDKNKNMCGIYLTAALLSGGGPQVLITFIPRNYFIEQDLFSIYSNKYGIPYSIQGQGMTINVREVDSYLRNRFEPYKFKSISSTTAPSLTSLLDSGKQNTVYYYFDKFDQDQIVGSYRQAKYSNYVSAPKYYPNGGPALTTLTKTYVRLYFSYFGSDYAAGQQKTLKIRAWNERSCTSPPYIHIDIPNFTLNDAMTQSKFIDIEVPSSDVDLWWLATFNESEGYIGLGGTATVAYAMAYTQTNDNPIHVTKLTDGNYNKVYFSMVEERQGTFQSTFYVQFFHPPENTAGTSDISHRCVTASGSPLQNWNAKDVGSVRDLLRHNSNGFFVFPQDQMRFTGNKGGMDPSASSGPAYQVFVSPKGTFNLSFDLRNKLDPADWPYTYTQPEPFGWNG